MDCFFYVSTTGNKINNAILDIVQGKDIFLAINSIHIALIPKNENLELVSNFRPINLYNVVCKLISKVICNCLKTVMPLIISRM